MADKSGKKRKAELVRALLNVKGELLLLKREQKKLEEKLEDVLKSHASLATMMHEERKLLEELIVGSDNALAPRKTVELRRAA